MRWDPFIIDEKVRSKIVRLVEGAGAVFSFAAHRHLAALVASMGVAAEIGGELDRLGPALGATGQWHGEVIEAGGEIGVRLWSEGGAELAPRETGLAMFVNALSLSDGRLDQIVIFPAQIADEFRARGIDLVIVRDWILRSGLMTDRRAAIKYTQSNVWEIGQNIALTQAGLMRDCRLAFFGTHDVADHLLGATRDGIVGSHPLVGEILSRFAKVDRWSNYRLMLSYLIAMVLDDLAQPRWYQSRDHHLLAMKLLDEIARHGSDTDCDIFIPKAFTPILESLRAKSPAFPTKIDGLLALLYAELGGRSRLPRVRLAELAQA